MLESSGMTVTVEDVRTSLRLLIPAITTGNLPDMESKICQNLLELWLEELGKKREKIERKG